MSLKSSLFSKVAERIPNFEIPSIGKSVEIPVYLIHNSTNAEDYFFIFDFEQFVEQSKSGVFVRPKLLVWAGRDDFQRRAFARSFRESFTREFDLARSALSAGGQKAGWFSWGGLRDAVSLGGASFVANVVLLVGMSAGKMILSSLPLPNIFQEKSDETKLEDSIAQTQSKVDEALEGMEVKLHRELWSHAWRGATPGSMSGMDKDAWPLPDQVRQHLHDGKSGSWW